MMSIEQSGFRLTREASRGMPYLQVRTALSNNIPVLIIKLIVLDVIGKAEVVYSI